MEIKTKGSWEAQDLWLSESEEFYNLADREDNAEKRLHFKQIALKSRAKGLIYQNPDPKALKQA